MKKLQIIIVLVIVSVSLFAQKKTTTSAIIFFDASTSIDALPKATNKTVIAVIDTKTGVVQFEAYVRNFAFSNPTMQEHFNGKKWMNSDEFPKITFKGNIQYLNAVDFSKDGSYKTDVEGMLTVKGKEQKIKVPGTIVVQNEILSISTDFSVALEDYGISALPVQAGKVSKTPKIKVTAELK
ncbi:MAG: YceI family protein [Chitinophagaceae bacterium]